LESLGGLDTRFDSEFYEVKAIDQDSIATTGNRTMAKKAKKVAGKKAQGKKPAKKKVAAKKTAKRTYSVKAAKKTARAFVKAAGKRTTAATKSGKKMVSRAIKAIADVAAPIIPGGETKS
jgi:hypothetical protein